MELNAPSEAIEIDPPIPASKIPVEEASSLKIGKFYLNIQNFILILNFQ